MDTSDEFTTSFITLRKLTIAVWCRPGVPQIEGSLKTILSNNKLEINMNGCDLEILRKVIMK